MPDHTHPYSFEAIYPIQEAIDLAKNVKANPGDIVTHVKHGAGIVGCIAEKHDTEPEPFGAIDPTTLPDTCPWEDCDEEELADRILECCAPQGGAAAQADGSIILPILLPLISALLQRLLERWGR